MPIMGRRRFLNSANQRLRTLGNVGVVTVTAIRHIEGVVSTNIAVGPEAVMAIINGVPVSEPKVLPALRKTVTGDPGILGELRSPRSGPAFARSDLRWWRRGREGPSGSPAAGRFSRLGLYETRSGIVRDTGSTGYGRRVGTVGGRFGELVNGA